MVVSAPASGLLRFDNFELDVRAGELRKRGVKLRLQGQPLQVLATLLRHSGELVTREELRTEIAALLDRIGATVATGTDWLDRTDGELAVRQIKQRLQRAYGAT